MFDKGFFDGMFDFNDDGKLDSLERAADFGMFMNMIDSAQKDELASAGLDMDELDLMDEDERISAIEDAGLDPNDFDF
jgi:hypothetical protein